jgi:acetoacetate decarboxylase
MEIEQVKRQAFAMPLTNPAFPPGPYRLVNREYMIITYRTDRAALERVVPAPRVPLDDLVKYEFIRMPDSTGFGDYTESGQAIPVMLDGVRGTYTHAMYLNDHPPIAGGGSFGDFPRNLPPRRSSMTWIRSLARSITGGRALPSAPWDTSIGPCRRIRFWHP